MWWIDAGLGFPGRNGWWILIWLLRTIKRQWTAGSTDLGMALCRDFDIAIVLLPANPLDLPVPSFLGHARVHQGSLTTRDERPVVAARNAGRRCRDESDFDVGKILEPVGLAWAGTIKMH